MRNLYQEFFQISKNEKIRDKVMLARISTTIAIMLVCLAAMSFTAYAYFSYNVTSDSNMIKAANFEANVSIRIKDKDGNSVEVTTGIDKSHSAELKNGETYFVTLEHADQSTAKTGFVIVTAENCAGRYHTQQIGKDENGNTETLTFCITTSEDTTVTFYPHWGTSSYFGSYNGNEDNIELYITEGETIKLVINDEVDTDSLKEEITFSDIDSISRLELPSDPTTESIAIPSDGNSDAPSEPSEELFEETFEERSEEFSEETFEELSEEFSEDLPGEVKTYDETITVDPESGNASAGVCYGYTWKINSIDGVIAGEDVTICTTQEIYYACNPDRAVTIYAEKQADGTYVALRDAIVTPGSAADAGITIGKDQIAIVVHSSSANPNEAAQYTNWEDKVVAMAAKEGDVFEVDMDGMTVYAVIPEDSADTSSKAPSAGFAPSESPDTGDVSVLAFALLALVAVAGAAVAIKARG